jgi:integrase/recombinase XerD
MQTDGRGRMKQPEYRTVPVPQIFIEKLDLVFGIKDIQKRQKVLAAHLWSMSRSTAYRLVKRVMDRARIKGKQATGKNLRHGFGVAMVRAQKPLPLHILSQLMGHSDTKTTEVYMQVVGEEKRKMVREAWEG